jgi:hypothetical protein
MTDLVRDIPPIVLSKQEAMLPHSYRLIIKRQHCTNCNAINETSELYQVQSLRSRMGNKAGVTNSIPCDRFLWNVPFQVRHKMMLQTVPVCHQCYPDAPDLSTLPTVPRPETELMNSIAGTEGQEPTAGRGGKDSRKLTIDDI